MPKQAVAEKPKRKIGRPTSFRPEFTEQAFRLALLGAVDEDMAEFFGVSIPTFYAWKKNHPEFLKALTRGKVEADATVAHSLYHRANGYSHNAVKIFMPAGAKEPVYAPYTEHFPPDTAAATLWLKNRQPDKWRDKIDHEHSGEVTSPQGAVVNISIGETAVPLTVSTAGQTLRIESGTNQKLSGPDRQ